MEGIINDQTVISGQVDTIYTTTNVIHKSKVLIIAFGKNSSNHTYTKHTRTDVNYNKQRNRSSQC